MCYDRISLFEIPRNETPNPTRFSSPGPNFLESRISQSLSGNEDEEDADGGVHEKGDSKHDECSPGDKLANIRLSHAGEVERGVLAQPYQGEHRVQRVLVRGQAVDADGERKDELDILGLAYSHREMPIEFGRFWTYVESLHPRMIQEDQDERGPETTKHCQKANDEPHDQGRRDQIPQGLESKETGEGIPLHGLEDVVLGNVEYLGVVTAKFLDSSRHILGDRAGESDLSLGAREQERVEDLLGRGADILPGYHVSRRVRVGGEIPRGAGVRAGPSHPSSAALRRAMCSSTLLTEECRHLGILVTLLLGCVHRRSGGRVGHVAKAFQNSRRSLRARSIRIRRPNENRSPKLTNIMAAERHVLGNIEPSYGQQKKATMPYT